MPLVHAINKQVCLGLVDRTVCELTGTESALCSELLPPCASLSLACSLGRRVGLPLHPVPSRAGWPENRRPDSQPIDNQYLAYLLAGQESAQSPWGCLRVEHVCAETWLARVGAKLAPSGAELTPAGACLAPAGAELARMGADFAPVGANLARVGACVAPVGACLARAGARLARVCADSAPVLSRCSPRRPDRWDQRGLLCHIGAPWKTDSTGQVADIPGVVAILPPASRTRRRPDCRACREVFGLTAGCSRAGTLPVGNRRLGRFRKPASGRVREYKVRSASDRRDKPSSHQTPRPTDAPDFGAFTQIGLGSAVATGRTSWPV